MVAEASQPANKAQIGKLRAWLLAMRPATLSAAIVPVVVGACVAFALGGLDAMAAVFALLGAIFIQVGTNFANDVFDYEKGADTHERLGPTRAVQSGLITPASMRVGMTIAFGLAVLSGIYLISAAGPWVVAIGVFSIASGILYTGGPYPLGYNGLGDVFVMVFFGFVAVGGTVFVQMGTVPPLAIAASVPVGALATAILAVNNIRDRETDVRAGKRTVAVRFGRRAAVVEYGVLLTVSMTTPIGIYLSGMSGAQVLLPLLTLPWAIALFFQIMRREGSSLNGSLVGTAKLLLVFGALFSAGLVLGAHV